MNNPLLDPREEHFRVPGPHAGLHLFPRRLPPKQPTTQSPAVVLYVHGATRGEWDSLLPDADARWLFDAFTASPIKRDIKIGGATHLMHLEAGRYALYRESIGFLQGGDTAPAVLRFLP